MLDISEAEPAELADGAYMTADRRRIADFLRAQPDQGLDQLYLGALMLLFDEQCRIPGWTRFVPHALREIVNTLVRDTSRRERRVPYPDFVERIAKLWRSHGTFSQVPPTLHDPLAYVLIPNDIAAEMESLVDEHLGLTVKLRDQAKRFFRDLLGSERSGAADIDRVAIVWRDVQQILHKLAHASVDDSSAEIAVMQKQLEDIERCILACLPGRMVKGLEEVDEFLDAANS